MTKPPNLAERAVDEQNKSEQSKNAKEKNYVNVVDGNRAVSSIL